MRAFGKPELHRHRPGEEEAQEKDRRRIERALAKAAAEKKLPPAEPPAEAPVEAPAVAPVEAVAEVQEPLLFLVGVGWGAISANIIYVYGKNGEND